MKKRLVALLFLPSLGWATYIPVNGSTVVVQAANGNTTAIPVSGTFFQGTQPVSLTGFPLSPTGVNASTVAVINQTGNNLSVSIAAGSIGNTGFNVNNAPSVVLSTTGVSGSTVAVVNATGSTLAISGNLTGNQNVAVNAALPTGTNNIGTVNGSTVSVVNQSGQNLNVNLAAGSIANTGFNVNNAPTVVQSTTGVNGSTIAVVNATGNNLNVNITGGSIANTGFNVNNTPAVSQAGTYTVTPGTGTYPASQIGTYTVTPGTGNFPSPQVGTYVVTPGTGTWPASQIGTYTTTPGTGTTSVQGTLSDNGAAVTTNMVATVPGIYQTDYANGTAGTQGRNSSQDHGTDGLLWTAVLPSFRPASFSASTGTITTAASATDIAALCGNGTNTVLLYAVRASCTETTAGNVAVTILKRSSAYTGAWSTMTAVSQDSNYTGAVSSATWFTANPTVGTLVGNLDVYKLGCMASGTTSPNDIYISPADWRMKPIVLRGTGQCVAVNLNATTVTGGSFTTTFDWIETKTITP